MLREARAVPGGRRDRQPSDPRRPFPGQLPRPGVRAQPDACAKGARDGAFQSSVRLGVLIIQKNCASKDLDYSDLE